MLRTTALILSLTLACAGTEPAGMRPRPAPSDYPVQASTPDGTVIAAAVLSPEEVRNSFATDLKRGWIVVEVAVYPSKNQTPSIYHSDFVLNAGSGESRTMLRPVEAKTIAYILQKENSPKPSSPSDITLYPTANVGYGSGPGVYDPVTGGRRGGGWTTGVGVGVGIGGQPGRPPGPASTGKDRVTMEQELSDKGLPEGSVTAPVAGYLYFAVTGKRTPSPIMELQYLQYGGISLPLPTPKRK